MLKSKGGGKIMGKIMNLILLCMCFTVGVAFISTSEAEAYREVYAAKGVTVAVDESSVYWIEPRRKFNILLYTNFDSQHPQAYTFEYKNGGWYFWRYRSRDKETLVTQYHYMKPVVEFALN